MTENKLIMSRIHSDSQFDPEAKSGELERLRASEEFLRRNHESSRWRKFHVRKKH